MSNLTNIELTALEEQLKSESVLVAKYNSMANECNDLELKNIFQDIALKHQAHYNQLFQFLN